MTKQEFEKFIKDRLTADGFTKVNVSVSLFGNRASVTAKGPNGRMRKIKAELIQKRGKEIVKLDTVDQAWIDELEFFDAIFDDD